MTERRSIAGNVGVVGVAIQRLKLTIVASLEHREALELDWSSGR